MALKKPDHTWRQQGEEYAEKASRHTMHNFGDVYGLLAVYCEMRHASGDDRRAEEAAQAAVVEAEKRRLQGPRVGGRNLGPGRQA